jgi:hypothetical protein
MDACCWPFLEAVGAAGLLFVPVRCKTIDGVGELVHGGGRFAGKNLLTTIGVGGGAPKKGWKCGDW